MLGNLDSVSVIVTTPSFNSYKTKLSAIKIPIFLHFNLTEGLALSPKESVSSLVDKDGYFLSQGKFIWRCVTRQMNTRDVWCELEAQAGALQNLGIEVAGIDTHQHAHAFNPVSSVVYDYANDRNIECVRSYGQLKVLHPSTYLIKCAYWVMARASSPKKSPRGWREKKWRPFVMATWEKVESAPDNVVVITHPGTDFDCQVNLPKRVWRHMRRAR